MGSLRKHGSVYWIRYYKHGQRLEENTHTASHEEARDLLKQREGAVADGRPVSQRRRNSDSMMPSPTLKRTTRSTAVAPSRIFSGA